MKTNIPPVLITFSLVCFALSPRAQAVTPAPDGGYPGGNTAEGQNALFSLTTGQNNTAVGFNSLSTTTTGLNNTAIGTAALRFNTGDNNTASGAGALRNNTSGSVNVANGVNALHDNTTGYGNTAIGTSALSSNIRGIGNTAVGYTALSSNTRGLWNTATGQDALIENTTGESNTALGMAALRHNTEGNGNTAIGLGAGIYQTTGGGNVYIGAVGVSGIPGENNACYISSIFGQTSPGGVPVVINSNNKLGTATSSKRFKENIKSMDKASEALFSLQPVTFRYKKEIDVQGIPQFGLVAEDVEKVNPDLVVRDKEGKAYTVRYEAVNAMLLNEFLKEHRKNEEQEKTIAELKSGMTALAATVKEQASQIQKVSAQLEASKPTSQVVNNP
jgi:hypothetical protein